MLCHYIFIVEVVPGHFLILVYMVRVFDWNTTISNQIREGTAALVHLDCVTCHTSSQQ